MRTITTAIDAGLSQASVEHAVNGCDLCGTPIVVTTTLHSGGLLQFCGHHWREQESRISDAVDHVRYQIPDGSEVCRIGRVCGCWQTPGGLLLWPDGRPYTGPEEWARSDGLDDGILKCPNCDVPLHYYECPVCHYDGLRP